MREMCYVVNNLLQVQTFSAEVLIITKYHPNIRDLLAKASYRVTMLISQH